MHRHVSLPLIAAFALFAGCAKPDAPSTAATASLPPAKVRVATVRAANVPTFTEVTGTVRPVQRAQLAAKLMGTIEELPVTLGQRVGTGDLLVKISAGEVAARLVQAQAQLNATRRDLERERGLLKKARAPPTPSRASKTVSRARRRWCARPRSCRATRRSARRSRA
jgi:multidrug efflux pump subunit AcrA (membrane-fusion protein)